MTDRIILVLAANAHDFKGWCYAHDLSPHSRRVIYASSPRKVDGMRGFDVVQTDTCRLHPQADRIAQVVGRNLVKQAGVDK